MNYEQKPEVLEWARRHWLEASDIEKKNWEFVFPELAESEDDDTIYQAIETLEHEGYEILANKLKSLQFNNPKWKISNPHTDVWTKNKIDKKFEELVDKYHESEDERIRKWLYDYYSTVGEKNWIHSTVTCGQVLAWLEKQKDSAPNAKYIEDVAHAFEDGRKKGIEEKQKEQKPEWSEEDEAMIDRLIRHHKKEFEELCNDKYGHQEIVSDLKESCRERMRWLERLKSLKPQKQDNNISISPERLKELRDQSFEDGRKAGIAEMAKSMPMPEDTVLFQNGVKEGRRLEREDMPKWKKTNPMKGGCWSGETFVIQGKHPKLAYEQWTIDVEELFKKLLKEE